MSFYDVLLAQNLNGNSGGSTVTVDTQMSDTSTNPVQNKVIKEYVDGKKEIEFIPLVMDENGFPTIGEEGIEVLQNFDSSKNYIARIDDEEGPTNICGITIYGEYGYYEVELNFTTADTNVVNVCLQIEDGEVIAKYVKPVGTYYVRLNLPLKGNETIGSFWDLGCRGQIRFIVWDNATEHNAREYYFSEIDTRSPFLSRYRNPISNSIVVVDWDGNITME